MLLFVGESKVPPRAIQLKSGPSPVRKRSEQGEKWWSPEGGSRGSFAASSLRKTAEKALHCWIGSPEADERLLVEQVEISFELSQVE